MSDKMYHQEHLQNFERTQYVQQLQNSSQQYLTYPLSSTSSGYVYSQSSTTMCDLGYGSQNSYRTQNVCNLQNSFTEQIDPAGWIADPRIMTEIERGFKFSDKIETIEITSKDLSPVSCCSNVDLFPDFYKTFNKDNQSCCNKMNDNQWACNINQKYIDYPSCAQGGGNDESLLLERTVRYCSIQKSDELDSLTKSYQCNSEHVLIEQFLPHYNKNTTDINQHLTLQDCNLYNNTFDDKIVENNLLETVHNTQYFLPDQNICSATFNTVQNLEHHNDASNEESDIIVEESEEEITDYSEDQEKRYECTSSCVICNILYTPVGNQFYYLTSETPLTMSSQKPVFLILTEIVGKLFNVRNYLCSQCLGLINTLDHLQMKLENCRKELYEKFKKTCKVNGLNCNKQEKNIKSDCKKRLKSVRFKCKVCKKVFSLKTMHHYHMKKHKVKKFFLCEYCGKKIFKASKIKVHMNSHVSVVHQKNKQLQPYVCKICVKHFRTRSNLVEHENFCSGHLPYKCDRENCDKKFPSLTKLKNHIKLKHDKKFIAICSICNIGFVKMSDYKSHMTTHSTEKKYSCTKCEKTYKTLSNLNFHMKFHNEKLPFNCDLCGKGFMRKDYLETHVNLHKGIKNFSCFICDKKFASQKNLDSHMKYHDGSVKKKICNICGKSITTGFEEHLRTHTNLKEFSCNLCEMRFNTKGALGKHKKNKH